MCFCYLSLPNLIQLTNTPPERRIVRGWWTRLEYQKQLDMSTGIQKNSMYLFATMTEREPELEVQGPEREHEQILEKAGSSVGMSNIGRP